MRLSILFVTTLVAVKAVTVVEKPDTEWELFKLHFNKSYATLDEEILKKKIFELNQKRVTLHNEDYEKGLRTFMMGINHFSDMLPEEVNELNGPEETDDKTYGSLKTGFFKVPKHVQQLPASVDWRLKGAVTPVKNQKHCGSCWAFSSIGVLEGQNFRKTGKLVALSEQNLIDCVQGNHGCNAGRPHRAFDYARAHGVDTEESYPYEEKTGTCRYNKSHVGTSNVGAYLRVPKGDEEILKAAVALAGPVLVSIDSKHPSFHGYKGGVYYEKDCSKTQTHHSVLLVGYGTTEHGHDYWIVKNSWGEHWGEHGYIRMARNRGNNCNIAKFPLVPVV